MTTGQARYMIAAFANLKQNTSNNLYLISCLAHSLHRVAEKIRDDHPEVNCFIADMKVLKKSNKRINEYFETTNLSLPPDPSWTRWGSFITASQFYCQNFLKIKAFIKTLKTKDAAAISILQNQIKKDDLTKELGIH